jgi:TolB protein
MPRYLRLFLALLALTLLPFAPARGQLTIEIVGGAGTTIPIAIVPFEGESTYPLGISGVVGADLARSGMFKLVNTEGVTPRPARAEEVQAGVWRSQLW